MKMLKKFSVWLMSALLLLFVFLIPDAIDRELSDINNVITESLLIVILAGIFVDWIFEKTETED